MTVYFVLYAVYFCRVVVVSPGIRCGFGEKLADFSVVLYWCSVVYV